jgi:CRP/FNR family transcriptional regulator
MMLTVQEKVRFLRDIPTFDSLSAEQIEDLAEFCDTQTFVTSSYIFRQGDIGCSFFVVVDGRVAIEREVDSATDTVALKVVGPHEYFGEMSLFYNVPRTLTATTMEDTVVLQIRQDAFNDLCPSQPRFVTGT